MREGGCSCGAVRYRLASDPLFVHCCHCLNCQRQTGSAFVVNLLIEADRVEVLEGAPAVDDLPRDDGPPQRVFRCPACRIALFSEAVGKTGRNALREEVWGQNRVHSLMSGRCPTRRPVPRCLYIAASHGTLMHRSNEWFSRQPQAIARAETVSRNAARLGRSLHLYLGKTPGQDGLAALLLLVRGEARSDRRRTRPDR
jgi:hypothetical protein